MFVGYLTRVREVVLDAHLMMGVTGCFSYSLATQTSLRRDKTHASDFVVKLLNASQILAKNRIMLTLYDTIVSSFIDRTHKTML